MADLRERIGILRQLLNEDRITDPKKMITNEYIESVLEVDKHDRQLVESILEEIDEWRINHHVTADSFAAFVESIRSKYLPKEE